MARASDKKQNAGGKNNEGKGKGKRNGKGKNAAAAPVAEKPKKAIKPRRKALARGSVKGRVEGSIENFVFPTDAAATGIKKYRGTHVEKAPPPAKREVEKPSDLLLACFAAEAFAKLIEPGTPYVWQRLGKVKDLIRGNTEYSEEEIIAAVGSILSWWRGTGATTRAFALVDALGATRDETGTCTLKPGKKPAPLPKLVIEEPAVPNPEMRLLTCFVRGLMHSDDFPATAETRYDGKNMHMLRDWLRGNGVEETDIRDTIGQLLDWWNNVDLAQRAAALNAAFERVPDLKPAQKPAPSIDVPNAKLVGGPGLAKQQAEQKAKEQAARAPAPKPVETSAPAAEGQQQEITAKHAGDAVAAAFGQAAPKASRFANRPKPGAALMADPVQQAAPQAKDGGGKRDHTGGAFKGTERTTSGDGKPVTLGQMFGAQLAQVQTVERKPEPVETSVPAAELKPVEPVQPVMAPVAIEQPAGKGSNRERMDAMEASIAELRAKLAELSAPQPKPVRTDRKAVTEEAKVRKNIAMAQRDLNDAERLVARFVKNGNAIAALAQQSVVEALRSMLREAEMKLQKLQAPAGTVTELRPGNTGT